MGAATKVVEQPLVELGKLWGRIGGDKQRVLRMVGEAGGTIEKTWDGQEGVAADVAARVVQEHEELKAESERFQKGYAAYCKQHEQEKRAVLSAAFDKAYREQVRQQREYYRTAKFVSADYNFSLSPQRHKIASDEANEALAAFERKNPLLSDVEWAKRHKEEWQRCN